MSTADRLALDRDYHDTIASDYDRVIVAPRWHAANWLFRHAVDLLPPQRTRMLDIGCGTGHMLRRFAHRFGEAVGVDHSTAMLAQARRSVQARPGHTLALVQAEVLGFLGKEQRRFELITCVGFAHHLGPALLPQLFSLVRERLAPGGLFVLAEPTAGSWAEPPWLARWNAGYRARPEVYTLHPEDPDEAPLEEAGLRQALVAAGLPPVRDSRGWEVFPRHIPATFADRVAIDLMCRRAGDTGPVLCLYCRAA